MVHHNENRYWSTLKDEPDTHDEFLIRCDLHLTYVGKGIYAQLIPRTEPLEYAIFGTIQSEELSDIEMKPLIVGSLTADEDTTLNYLLNTAISRNISQTELPRCTSPSAGSKRELPRVEHEPRSSSRFELEPTNLTLQTDNLSMKDYTLNVLKDPKHLNQVPVLNVKQMSSEDIESARDNLKKRPKT